MSPSSRRNVAASVRQRLTNLARERHEELQLVLTRYGLERLLYRLTQSPHAHEFVLKGAALFQLWTGHTHRATRDLDLLGVGEPSIDRLRRVFLDVCGVDVADDGVAFRTETMDVAQIKEEDEYQGIRLRIDARLGNARLPLQVDIGFGDAVTPGPQTIEYPSLLDFPPPRLQAYPQETVVAEKFQALVHLGMANSRMKDYFDLWTMARDFTFAGDLVCAAIAATFARRATALPAEIPLGLSREFATDRAKRLQWQGFLRKGRLAADPPPLDEVVALLAEFLMPPVAALRAGAPWNAQWRDRAWDGAPLQTGRGDKR
jgi:predicted nucleotidyltransferase component of viral defense system